jgi:hypothetical protein
MKTKQGFFMGADGISVNPIREEHKKFLHKEQKMRTKQSVFIGIAVLLTAAIFTLAGCGDAEGGPGGGGGGPTTAKLTQQETNVLVLTLTGTGAILRLRV